ncbi:nucleoside-diphosphate kinase [endosymbiont GvMRE of Glomus versiforme]|uniref:nucleoside-diphosphate kinase n=1 Tax=endosymbiont GvMRE of Glomus versiforme TaxID=2039283 RepID=UPI000EE3B1F1|nr:nucleoside-diphosphate kinase [endosymbiont GvMRE of Glomus versiforme]RHZ37143.1 Nucleoside diphosphate kinase B [endosymbiont GvMRE of Glomus versiforme]
MNETSHQKEKTFIMIKPDGIKRKLVGEIIQRLEKKGFQMLALKMLQANRKILVEHYTELKAKFFFEELIDFMLSGPVIAMIWQGENIINTARQMLGATNPAEAAPGTIRGDFYLGPQQKINENICHASDSLESAKKETALWFPKKNYTW